MTPTLALLRAEVKEERLPKLNERKQQTTHTGCKTFDPGSRPGFGVDRLISGCPMMHVLVAKAGRRANVANWLTLIRARTGSGPR
jgi:hypothetical protein